MEKGASRKWNIAVKIILPLLATILISPSPLQASSHSVIINEVVYDPVGPDLGYEWIEFKNLTDYNINLKSWKIQKAGSDYVFALVIGNFPMKPGEIRTVGEINVPEGYRVSMLGFQNGGSETDSIRLLDQDMQIIDTLLYDEPNTNNLLDDFGLLPTIYAPDVKEGHSLCRISSLDTDYMSDFVECSTPTFGEENVFPPISVITGPENGSTGETLEFSGLDSTDQDGEITSYKWNIDSIGYENTEENISISFDEPGEYELKLEVTDDHNLTHESTLTIQILDNEIKVNTIEEVKEFEDGEEVIIEGVITASPGTLYSGEGYVEDETGGIRIKVLDDMTIEYGKAYRLYGEKSTTYDEPRITIDEAEEILKDFDITPYAIAKISDMKNHIGKLVSVSGEVASKSGYNLYIISDIEDTHFRINISKYSNIEIPSDIKGQMLTVAGIVSQYGTDEEGNPKLKIMPRFETDITSTETGEVLAVTGYGIQIMTLLPIILFPIALFYIHIFSKKQLF